VPVGSGGGTAMPCSGVAALVGAAARGNLDLAASNFTCDSYLMHAQ